MRHAVLAAVAVVFVGCAITAQSRGERALALGDFPSALAEFQTALAEHPERVSALQGLAVAQYKTGALADAATGFDQASRRRRRAAPRCSTEDRSPCSRSRRTSPPTG